MALAFPADRFHFLAELAGGRFVLLAETKRRYLVLTANHQGNFDPIRHFRNLVDRRERFYLALK